MKETSITVLKFFKLMLAFVCTMPLGAATLTWSGGASGDVSAAANWGGTAPASGDTLVFPSVVTLSGALDIGSGGVTLQCDAVVTNNATFSGAGVITKTGDGDLTMNKDSTYTGGTLIKAGMVYLYPPKSLGTGTITIDRSTSGANSIAYFYGTNTTKDVYTIYPNSVHVKGTYVDVSLPATRSAYNTVSLMAPIRSHCGVQIDGTVTGDGSIFIRNQWQRSLIFNSTVTVPEGSTIAYDGRDGNGHAQFKQEVLGSFVKASSGAGWNQLILYAPSGRASESLATHQGDIVLKDDGVWRGSTLVVTNLPYTDKVTRINNAAKTAFRSDVSIYIGTNKTTSAEFYHYVSGQCVAHLYLNGVEQPAGCYRKGMLGGTLKGDAELIVTGNADALIWTGGASGDISTAANWGGTAPAAGDVLVFTNADTALTGSFDFGSKGLEIICQKNMAVSVAFSGSGALTKTGSGMLTLSGTSTYAGGTVISQGILEIKSEKAAGTGTITVDRTQSGATSVVRFTSDSDKTTTLVNDNDIHVKGTYVDMSLPKTNGETSDPIQGFYKCQLGGLITGDGSIVIRNRYDACNLTMTNTVSVPFGSTIAADSEGGNSSITFKGPVYGSLTKFSSCGQWAGTTLYQPSGRPGETLKVHAGTLYFIENGAWLGSTIVLSNLSHIASVSGVSFYNKNTQMKQSDFARDLTIYTASSFVASDGKTVTNTIAFGIADQVVSKIYVDGVRQPVGDYYAGDLKGVMCTSSQSWAHRLGSFWVGEERTWTGGASGKWSEASNWDPAVVPGEGASVCFTNAVTVEAEATPVDFGSLGLMITNASGKVVLANDFTGTGSLLLRSGTVNFSGTIGSADATLDVRGGTNVICAAAHLTATNIVLKKATRATCCAVRLESGKSIDTTTALDVGSGAYVVLPETSSKVRVGRLVVAGTEKRRGAYRAAKNPTWLGGNGVLYVGPETGFMIIVR